MKASCCKVSSKVSGFAEETLRKYPIDGDRKLRNIAANHREIGLAYNERFADGIEDVLSNLENMGR